jgi:hypothetical protein
MQPKVDWLQKKPVASAPYCRIGNLTVACNYYTCPSENRAELQSICLFWRGSFDRFLSAMGWEDLMADLLEDVANALHWTLAIPRYRVTPAVEHGLVVLRGIVDSIDQRSCAEAIVRMVPGVHRIRNDIIVKILD